MSEHTLPETRLFRHIILTAVLDAVWGNPGGDRRQDARVRAAALHWFQAADEDFSLVCECAGLHPGEVRKGALAYIRRCISDPNLQTYRPSLHEHASPKRRAA